MIHSACAHVSPPLEHCNILYGRPSLGYHRSNMRQEPTCYCEGTFARLVGARGNETRKHIYSNRVLFLAIATGLFSYIVLLIPASYCGRVVFSRTGILSPVSLVHGGHPVCGSQYLVFDRPTIGVFSKQLRDEQRHPLVPPRLALGVFDRDSALLYYMDRHPMLHLPPVPIHLLGLVGGSRRTNGGLLSHGNDLHSGPHGTVRVES